MNIMITGASGQLGKELCRQLSQTNTVTGLSRNQMDMTKKDEVFNHIQQLKPELIIHSAAFTAVDQCEADRKKAFNINWRGTSYVTEAAGEVNAKLIYISSDYVFDGKKKAPYTEKDHPYPLSIYGLSKLYGEQCVLTYKKGTIIRTSWLFGHEGKNFVKTILHLAKQKKNWKVVNDQIGSPTYVKDLTEILIKLIDKKTGIYHVANSGSCSWYEFAKTILKEGGSPEMVTPVSSEYYGAKAKRPAYSVLAHDALTREKLGPMRSWEEALKEYFQREKEHD
ncbi:dTDP-4-dehydrorhamnose reductase [Bacillus sp. F19]|nr:dTDP-4-dehydrorhamnose reductase [Bacillus sp. F19]